MISGLNRLVRRFWLNRRGNYAVIVAIAAIPLFGAVGLAVDVTRALETKSRLANAADAAVLASLASGSPAMTQAMIMTGPGPIATGKQDSETFFKSNLRSDLLSHVYAN
jgi:Flp pilus assembly protein TadG